MGVSNQPYESVTMCGGETPTTHDLLWHIEFLDLDSCFCDETDWAFFSDGPLLFWPCPQMALDYVNTVLRGYKRLAFKTYDFRIVDDWDYVFFRHQCFFTRYDDDYPY